MNNTEMIRATAVKTGESEAVCAIVIKAFEKVQEQALISKIRGHKMSRAEIIAQISEGTGVSPELTARIVTALEAEMGDALSRKLRRNK